MERQRFREEERMRKVQMQEERELKKELDKTEPAKEKHVVRTDTKRKKDTEREPDLDLLPVTWVSSYLPIRQIKNGIIYTTDHRYVKLIEILPINFLLRSPSEQRNIIMSFMSYLKIAPVRIQFKVVSKKADISEYIEKIQKEAERECDTRVKMLQEDYAKLIEKLGRKEAITRRFFMVFEYQSYNNNKNPREHDILPYMKSVVQTAKKYLSQCGNVVLEHENDTRFLVDVLYQILNRKAKEDRTVEKAIFVDEAWKLLVSNELAGEYLLEIFKVIRAYGGSAICATQDLVDFFALKGGKLGRGILNNSKTKIILNMEPSEAENIRKELDLSEAEAMSIARFERGTGLISTNSNNLIVDFKASQLEKDLITTDRKDLQELKERLQKYGRQAYGKQAI